MSFKIQGFKCQIFKLRVEKYLTLRTSDKYLKRRGKRIKVHKFHFSQHHILSHV